MDISNIVELECSSCSKVFYTLLSGAILANDRDIYDVFSSRSDCALVFFKPMEEESDYFYLEQTEARARKAYPEFDLRRTVLIKQTFKDGDSHRYDPVFGEMRSFVTLAECIHCANQAHITEIINDDKFLSRGGKIIGLEGTA